MKVSSVSSNYTNQRIRSVRNNNQVRTSGTSFRGNPYAKSVVFENMGKIDLFRWNRKDVWSNFRTLMQEIQNSAAFNITKSFVMLSKMLEQNTFKDTLLELGEEDSPALKRIMADKDDESRAVLASAGRGKYITIRNAGPQNLWKNLFGIKGKNEVIIGFFNDCNDSSLEFSLDKADDYVVEQFSKERSIHCKLSYYTRKDGIKKELDPKVSYS